MGAHASTKQDRKPLHAVADQLDDLAGQPSAALAAPRPAPVAGRAVAVRRTLSLTGADVDAARSKRGALSGRLQGDTLSKLSAMLKDYHKSKNAEYRESLVQGLLGLSNLYLEKHRKDPKAQREVAFVEDLYAEARRERDQSRARQQYLRDATGQGGTTNLKHLREGGKVASGAKLAMANTPLDEKRPVAGVSDESRELIKKYGLTEEEVLAIRAFTASNYLHINPATSNSPERMLDQNKESFTDAERTAKAPAGGAKAYAALADDDPYKSQQKKLKTLFEEGALHGAITLAGLQKLPVKKGLAYRGARMNDKELTELYSPGKAVLFKSFTSTAITQHPAKTYAAGGGDYAPRADQTISVLATLKLTNARDIQDLSVYGAIESEWVLLPGATFKVEKIEDLPSGVKGRPPATRWVSVTLTQTK